MEFVSDIADTRLNSESARSESMESLEKINMKRGLELEDTDDGEEGNEATRPSKRCYIETGDSPTSASGSPLMAANSTTNRKSTNAIHGNLFQLKLLMLFLIRGIGKEYHFQLGTEIADHGKFDDLVFKYEIPMSDQGGKQWRYRFLQAKHRQNEVKAKIKSSDLFDSESDFSLSKYFRSYCQDIVSALSGRRPEDIESCIICTNISFDTSTDLTDSGIELVPLCDSEGNPHQTIINDQFLAFHQQVSDKKAVLYQIRNTETLKKTIKESEIRWLAEKLHEFSTKNKTFTPKDEPFKRYHWALVKQNVIDLKSKRFHEHFLKKSRPLSPEANQLRKIFYEFPRRNWRKWELKLDDKFGGNQSGTVNQQLPNLAKDKDIDDFFSKLIFAVNTPNEVDLDDVLKSEVAKYFKLRDSDLLSQNFLKEMLDWFKGTEAWMPSQHGKDILNGGKRKLESLRFTSISFDYQEELANILQFNQDAIIKMVKKLYCFDENFLFLLDSSSKVMRITSELRECTAAKVIAAFKFISEHQGQEVCDHLFSDGMCSTEEDIMSRLKMLFTQYKDSYLMTSLSRSRKYYDKFQQALAGENFLLLIVVCDNEEFVSDDQYASLILDHQKGKNKVILIGNESNNGSSPCLRDTITYEQLSEGSKKTLLSKEISFQGSDQTVENLIENCNPEEVICERSIGELMVKREKILIPSFNRPHFRKSHYVKRRVRLMVLNEDGDEVLLENNVLPSSNIIAENELFVTNEQNRAIVISGEAGIGKSTFMSHYYEEIKKANPHHWVILLNLVSQAEVFSKLEFTTVGDSFTYECFVNFPEVVTSSSFARSLLKHRLKTGYLITFYVGRI